MRREELRRSATGAAQERLSITERRRDPHHRAQQGIDGMAPTVYDYDSMGHVCRQTLLLDADAPDDASKNRIITHSIAAVEEADGMIYQVSTESRSTAASNTLSRSEQTLLSDSAELESKRISIDERGNSTTTVTDIAGRTTSVTDAAGNVTTTAYDTAHDLPSVITDAQGNTRCYRYDARGRKVAEWGTAIQSPRGLGGGLDKPRSGFAPKGRAGNGVPASQPACFGYDEADNMTSLAIFRAGTETISSDPTERTDGDVTTWLYDPATGLELSKTYADNSSVVKSYDAFNRLATETDARGNVKTHTYESARGLLVGTTYSVVEGTAATTARSYAYNHLGQLTQVVDDAGTRTIAYNTYGEQESDALNAGTHTHLITEQRDSYGRSIGYTYARSGAQQHRVTTGYGADGRIATAGFLHGNSEKQFAYGYLPGSNLLQTLAMPNNMTLTQSYESQRDLLTGMVYHRGGTALVAQRTYTYDTLGRPLTRSTTRSGQPTRNDSFSHNERSELSAATLGSDSYSYAYDNIGNRTNATEVGVLTAYASNNLNQYTAVGEFTPTFDADGNQTLVKTSTGIWAVQYNAENRPVSFTNSASNTVVECTYDSMGRRATKKVTTNGSVTSYLRYIYRGYLQIAAIDAISGTFQWFLVWDSTQSPRGLGGGLDKARSGFAPQGRAGNGVPASQPIATRPLAISKDRTWYTYGWDLTKNICEVFGSAGYIRTAYTYTPYGKVSASGDVEQPVQWSSEYTDTELSLVYYNYRYYNPKQGQWLGRDIVQNNNEYEIAKNNCIRIHDYLGAIGVRYYLRKNIELAEKVYCRYQQLRNIAKLKGIIWLYSGSEPVCSTGGECEKITVIVEVENPCDIFPYNKVGHKGIGIGDNYYDLGPDQEGEWIKFYKNENIKPWWRINPDLAPFDVESLGNILNDVENHSANPTIAITFCSCAKNAAKTEQYWKKKYQDMANGIKKEYSLIGLNCSTSVWESLGMYSFPIYIERHYVVSVEKSMRKQKRGDASFRLNIR